MNSNLVATAKTLINAPKGNVWEALITPHAIKQYMFGTDVSSTWHEGDAIIWKGEMKGKPYEDKGVILKIDPERSLQYTHFSPASGQSDVPQNYHTITIDLTDEGPQTQVRLTQDNNSSGAARDESAKNWHIMLDGLKQYVEKSA